MIIFSCVTSPRYSSNPNQSTKKSKIKTTKSPSTNLNENFLIVARIKISNKLLRNNFTCNESLLKAQIKNGLGETIITQTYSRITKLADDWATIAHTFNHFLRDGVVAFITDGEITSGTQNAVNHAKKHKKKVVFIS